MTVPRGSLRPLLDEERTSCVGCACLALWSVKGEIGSAALCSPCVLYASALIESIEDLTSLITGVEATMGRRLTRDDQGRLQGPDADRIVFSICAVSHGAPKTLR